MNHVYSTCTRVIALFLYLLIFPGSFLQAMFGSASLLDINRDGTQDVLINGRSAELQTIDGKTGELICKFFFHKTRNGLIFIIPNWYQIRMETNYRTSLLPTGVM